MERELTLTAIYHPQFIDTEWQLVEHPTVDPLTKGDPTLGWEGDPRLAVYLYNPTKQFVLWRLENDEQYRPVCKLPPNASITQENINRLIRKLQMIDQRNGHNPYEAVMAAQEYEANAIENERQSRLADFADKFHFALSRAHLPGVTISRVRNILPRR